MMLGTTKYPSGDNTVTYLIMGIRPRAFISIISLLAGIFIHSAALAESRLILLGSFPAVEEGQADALSDDGAVVTGSSGSKAFRWENEADGLVELEVLVDQVSSTTEAISGNGLKIFGRSRPADKTKRIVAWTQTGVENLNIIGVPHAASFDGSVMVGELHYQEDGAFVEVAFRRSDITAIGLGWLTETANTKRSRAYAVSSDGAVIAGESISEGFEGSFVTEAFRWTASTGMVGLGFLDEGVVAHSHANAISHSGDIIAGWANTLSGADIFLWKNGEGMTSIQTFTGSNYPRVFDMSAEGEVIVGHIIKSGFTDAYRWSEADGFQSINEWLNAAGVDTTGRRFLTATAVSADGNTVVGIVTDEALSGTTEPYLAIITNDLVHADGFE